MVITSLPLFPLFLESCFYPFYEASTCYWFWFSPAARSAWRATLPAPPWLSPSTLTPVCESYHLGSEERRVEDNDINDRAGHIEGKLGIRD